MMKWNVDPEIVQFGNFALRYYSLMFVIGFIAMGEYVKRVFVKYGKDPVLVGSLTTHIIVAMLIGSRLAHCLFYEPQYYLSNPLEILKVWEGGLASHGGYVGVFIGVWLFLKKNPSMGFLWLMDIVCGPALFVGGLIRLGNLFNSEIYGNPTDVPWAMVFEKVDLIPRHPSMIYESIGYFTIAFILFWMEKKKFNVWNHGTIVSWSVIISFTFRFFIEFTKAEQSTLTVFNTINMGQVLSLVCVAAGCGLMWYSNRKLVTKPA